MRFILRVLADYLLALLLLCGYRGLALGNPGFWRFRRLGGGDIRVPRGLLGYLWVRMLFLGPVFHTCQSRDFTELFGQVMHILGIEIALIFPL